MASARRALVTGGNRGIGREIAEGLIAAGIEVVVAGRDAAAVGEAAADMGGQALVLDLEAPETFEAALAEAGDIDILVNNAGVLFREPLFEDPAKFAITMQVMVHAPYSLMRAVLPGMGRRGYGRIVNLSSGWGSFAEGLNGPNAYGTAKAALNALTLAASREAPAGVKINAMCPGWVRTRMGGPEASRSVEQGADTALWLAALADDGPNGGFFRDRRPIAW